MPSGRYGRSFKTLRIETGPNAETVFCGREIQVNMSHYGTVNQFR